jgi:hypothetical protein
MFESGFMSSAQTMFQFAALLNLPRVSMESWNLVWNVMRELGVDRGMIMKERLKKQGVRVRTAFIWLRMGSSDWNMRTRKLNFDKRKGISTLAE